MFYTQSRLANLRRISHLLASTNVLEDVQIQGWVTKLHKKSKYSFAHINDGASTESIQVVIEKNLVKNLHVGCAVKIIGNWVNSVGPKQSMELFATQCIMSGQNEKNPVSGEADNLRKYIHLRTKHPAFASILRLRSILTHLTHKFFMMEGFYHVDPPILSLNDCEGGGETFVVTNPSDKDYFGVKDPVFLPVSGQLHLEAIAGGIPNIYTMNPTFRAEHSHTRQHLSEFRMLEAECAFMDSLDDLTSLVEKYIKFVVRNIQDFDAEINNLNNLYTDESNVQRSSLTLIKMIDESKEFPRISYEEAMSILGKLGSSDGLNKSGELLLVKEFNSPVFVTQFPSNMKPFYMKRDESEQFAECFDLLAPYVGELAGGSIREHDSHKLRKSSNLPNLKWYYEIREYGHPVTCGFGLGIERFMQSLFGILNIKDTIPFPRSRLHIVEVIFGSNGGEVTENSIYWALHSQVSHLYGIGCIQSSFQVKVCQAATSIVVLKADTNASHMITSAIPFVFTVGNSDAVLRIIYQGSSMRSVERTLIKINLGCLYSQLRDSNTPSEKAELQQAIASITGSNVAHIKM